MNNDILKSRSSLGCVSAALNILSLNFSKIFKATWMWVLMASLVAGLSAFIKTPASDTSTTPMAEALWLGLTILVSIVNILLNTRIISGVIVMFTNQTQKKAFKKVLMTWVLSLAITLALGAVIILAQTGIATFEAVQQLPPTTLIILQSAILCVCMLIVALLLSPFIYSVTKYIVVPDLKFSHIVGSNYHHGLRRLGFLFSTALAMVLIDALIMMLMCIPGIVTNMASNIDQAGVLTGDESGLPTAFPWLNFLSTTLLMIVVGYLMIWGTLVCIYAYGSVEATCNKLKDTDKSENINNQ